MVKQANILLLSFTLLCLTLTNARELDEESVTTIPPQNVPLKAIFDQLIDDNIDAIQAGLRDVDSVALPDLKIFRGLLSKGQLNNISNVTRTGNCSVTYTNKTLSLEFNMGWNNGVTFNYDYTYTLLLFPRHGKLKGSVNKILINLIIDLDFNGYLIILNNLEVTKIGKLDLQLNGTFGDEIRSIIGTLVMNQSKQSIINAVEKVTTDKLKSSINSLNELIHNRDKPIEFVNRANSY